jgi:hypothetical protein
MKVLQAVVTASTLFLVSGIKPQDKKSPRDYFEEMKNAGTFVHTVTDAKGEKTSVLYQGYVCFAENSPMADNGGVFLTFQAFAYDKHYAEAQAIFLSNANKEERLKAFLTTQDIQRGQPYVGFLTDEIMSAAPADVADFFRKGGEDLKLSLYMTGVKSWTVSLHRLKEDDKWNSADAKMDFAVESSTMRFLWSMHGDKPVLLNGHCEKINKDRS